MGEIKTARGEIIVNLPDFSDKSRIFAT